MIETNQCNRKAITNDDKTGIILLFARKRLLTNVSNWKVWGKTERETEEIKDMEQRGNGRKS